ncbi:MAG: Plasmid pRiA4b ORF-3 family protein [Parcubacteria group bacterium GW2011_GWA1_47_8]|nr:MAG: Plasmid pRiA4b ORF-3 family protein [Parcubacteria group bacterium GW2011_GWA1_47_8]
MKDTTKKKIFQFKITLNYSTPKIWRRIQVPAEYTFFDLHVAIQDAMGWTDSHLHGFRITQKDGLRPIVIQYPNPEESFADYGERDERKEFIADYFDKITKQCVYEYDFGDGWVHTVLFEKELSHGTGINYPRCAAGKNACPPEDCGGVGGYEDMQSILKNPKHPERKELLSWLYLENADEFDPKEFDLGEVVFNDPREVLKEYELRFGR